MPRFSTRNSLPESVRDEMAALLNAHLANAGDLFAQVKYAHWNVKGPQFIALHELFDSLAEEVEGYADLIAERATALGGVAMGTARMTAAGSQLPEFPEGVFEGTAVVALLAERFARWGAAAREAIETAGKAGDQGTADLFTEVSRGLDKSLWFLEAHLGV
jgi:starvation-inducible DNA-binding protein